MQDKCIIDGCDHPRRTVGYCLAHWRAWKSDPADLLFVAYPPVRRVYVRIPLPDKFVRDVLRSDDGCYDWSGLKDQHGYGLVCDGRNHIPAHRVAWEIADGEPPPSDLHVLHTCDNPPCTRNDERGIYIVNGKELPRWGHLFLGTDADNVADMIAKGRANPARGSRSGSAKLTEREVATIRELCLGGVMQKDVALVFNVDRSTISNIVTGKYWRLSSPTSSHLSGSSRRR